MHGHVCANLLRVMSTGAQKQPGASNSSDNQISAHGPTRASACHITTRAYVEIHEQSHETTAWVLLAAR